MLEARFVAAVLEGFEGARRSNRACRLFWIKVKRAVAAGLRLESWIEWVGNCLDNPKYSSVLVRWIEQTVHRLRHDCAGNPKQGTCGPLQPVCSQIARQF